jgi:probable phosphoglycerate mutase
MLQLFSIEERTRLEKAIDPNYTTLYIVRHGGTEWNRKDILQGRLDSKLTKQGLHQAAELAKKLENVHFDAAFSVVF